MLESREEALTAVAIVRKLMTAEEFAQLPRDDTFQELIRGEVRTSPPPQPPHGRTSGEVYFALATFVKLQELGAVYVETGFRVERDPDTVLAPDVSFVRAELLPSLGSGGYPDVVPDLVVEVVSPSESARSVERRMREWLQFGARLVWAPDPRRKSVAVFREGEETKVLGADGMLDGGDVLPGFSCPVRAFFPE